MMKRQSVNSPLDRCESYIGWKVHQTKELAPRECNTVSATKRRFFASEPVRQITKPASEPVRRNIDFRPFAQRFFARVQQTRDCWLWTAGKDAYGYGQLTLGEAPTRKAHRLSWMLVHGWVPSSVHVLHKCDVRNCVNPDHLFLGDQAANMKDAAAKGRLHGPRIGRRKVSDADVAAIIAAPATLGVVVRLARQYGVTKGFVSLVRSGQRRAALLPMPGASSVARASHSLLPPSTVAEGQA